jgi:hypothetical protein
VVSQQLADFFDTISQDSRIGANHIVIYLALVNVWQHLGFPDDIQVSTYEMMQVTRIKAIDTYLKHLRGLAVFGYISYQPAVNDQIKAVIRFRRL